MPHASNEHQQDLVCRGGDAASWPAATRARQSIQTTGRWPLPSLQTLPPFLRWYTTAHACMCCQRAAHHPRCSSTHKTLATISAASSSCPAASTGASCPARGSAVPPWHFMRFGASFPFQIPFHVHATNESLLHPSFLSCAYATPPGHCPNPRQTSCNLAPLLYEHLTLLTYAPCYAHSHASRTTNHFSRNPVAPRTCTPWPV